MPVTKKDQVSVLIHPDITARMNAQVEKRMWSVSRFVEDAIVKLLEELEAEKN